MMLHIGNISHHLLAVKATMCGIFSNRKYTGHFFWDVVLCNLYKIQLFLRNMLPSSSMYRPEDGCSHLLQELVTFDGVTKLLGPSSDTLTCIWEVPSTSHDTDYPE
jgi:hypothetical protein